MKISTSATVVIAILMNLFPGALLSIFGQDDAFIQAGIPVLRVATSAMIIMSFSVVWLNAVTGSGNSRVTLIIEAIVIVLYCIYIYVILEHLKLSIVWGWMSEWLYWISLFLLSWLYMRSGKWKNKVI